MLYAFAFTTSCNTRSQICVLFIEFSFAFYKIIPPQLYDKLLVLCISRSMCKWIFDFLINRVKAVKVNNILASVSINVGATQSCILSAILILNCISCSDWVRSLKFADDTTVVGPTSCND